MDAWLDFGGKRVPLTHVAEDWVIAAEDVTCLGSAWLVVQVDGHASHREVRPMSPSRAGERCGILETQPGLHAGG